MCKVSVIIPVYNTEKYLPACLDSVLNQTLKELELICIDDCSPDRCGEILDEYAARDSRVQVIHLPENHRQGYGRNRGLERAVGKYVYFLDSDDTIVPEALEELTEICDRDELDIVFFDSMDVYENEDLKKIYQPPFQLRKGNYRDDVYEGKDLLDDFTSQDEWTCYPQRIIFRREFLRNEDIWYPEGSEHEDEYFAFAGILAAKRARYVPKQYFILRVRPDSVMTSKYAPKNFHGYMMNYYYMNQFLAAREIDTYGSMACLARMLDRIKTLYQALNTKFDLSEVFVRPLDKTLYRCFISYYMGQSFNDHIDQEVLDEILKYRIVYIYGAKLTGIKFCEKLEHRGDILIGDYIAQDPAEVPSVVMGRRVHSIDDVELPKDAIVVAAIKVMYWEETKNMMEKRNIPCVFHRKL